MSIARLAVLSVFLASVSCAVLAGEAGGDRPLSAEQKANLKKWTDALGGKDEKARSAAVDGMLALALVNGADVAAETEPLTKSGDEKAAAAAKRIMGRAKTNPIVRLKTNRGDIVLELYEDETPNTVANFVQLAEKKTYDGVIFHRCIANFMIQGGDPTGTGRGGVGYRFPDEIAGRKNVVAYGSLAMANRGPDTNGSQFFIVTRKEGCDFLNEKHTAFGEVIQGMDVVHAIEQCKKKGSTPEEPQKIEAATVVRKRDHKYEVKDANKE